MLKTNAQRAAVLGAALLVIISVLAAASYRPAAPDPAAPLGAVLDPAAREPAPWGSAAPDGATAQHPSARGPAAASDPGRGLDPAPDEGTARPGAPLTWAQLHGMLRQALSPQAAPGVHAASLEDFLDPGTDPADPVTRGGLVMAVVRALDLEELALAHPPAASLFQDVSPLHRAYAAIGLAHRLGLLPQPPGHMLRPEQPVTAAEAQEMLGLARALDIRAGQLDQVNAPGSSLSVAGPDGQPTAYVLVEDTLIVRNGGAVGAEELLPGDAVRTVADATGRLRLLVAEGPALSPVQQALAVLGPLLQELLTPEQTAAILARDWERAGTELKVNLYNRLLEHGLTPEEATAVLDQDWAALTEHGKARLTELAAARWSVSPDLVRAVLDQDWETARSHAEIVILEYLLNELLQAANA
ncbi:MAG TPA: hypothetical protein VKZ69_08795 [Limnochordales bacterium]|nr:hypothetical protein [Limnochordales bacterium]